MPDRSQVDAGQELTWNEKASYAVLEARWITKVFPGVVALRNVSVAVYPGEILAIVGENGAGKTTLMGIFAGVHPHSSFEGSITLGGSECYFNSVAEAEAAGIELIPQELQIAPHLSVAENLFLGKEPSAHGIVQWERLYAGAEPALREVDLRVDPTVPMGELGAAQQRLVVIARALSRSRRILILDEPTSSLSEKETGVLFKHLQVLKAQGIACIYVSHQLGEVFRIADRVAVLRDGEVVGTRKINETSPSEVISMMIGRRLSDIAPRSRYADDDTVLEVERLTVYDPYVPERAVVRDVSFKLRRREILGIFGLVGSGSAETARALFGVWPGRWDGVIRMQGYECRIKSTTDAVNLGLGLLTEDRREGIARGLTVRENISLASLAALSRWGVLRKEREVAVAKKQCEQLDVKISSVEDRIDQLSGGNQQKALLARWLSAKADILLLDQPTQGVDVGAREEIYRILDELVLNGKSVIVISRDATEVLRICDRVMVMCDGQIWKEFGQGEVTEEELLHWAAGSLQIETNRTGYVAREIKTRP